MIKSFKHKGLKRFFETGSLAGIDPTHRQKIRLRLAALDTAATIEDMDLPGFRLHPLKGDRQGLWAIGVSKIGVYHLNSETATPMLSIMRTTINAHV